MRLDRMVDILHHLLYRVPRVEPLTPNGTKEVLFDIKSLTGTGLHPTILVLPFSKSTEIKVKEQIILSPVLP
jgi:hypothetical protein